MLNPYNKAYSLKDLGEVIRKLSELLDLMGVNTDDFPLPFTKASVFQLILLLNQHELDESEMKIIASHPLFEETIEGYYDKEAIVRKHISLTIENAKMEFGDDFFRDGVYSFKMHKEMERRFIRADIVTRLVFLLDNSAILLSDGIKNKLKYQINSFLTIKEKLDFLYDYQAGLKHKKSLMPKKLNGLLNEFVQIEIERCLNKDGLLNSSSTLKEINKIMQSFKSEATSNAIYQSLINSLSNENFEQFKNDLYELLKRPSYWDISKDEPEKYYHIFMFGLLQSLDSRYEIKSNKESGFGRYDIMLVPINKCEYGVIFEIKKTIESSKFNEKEYVNALEQINSNEYNTELTQRGVKKILNVTLIFTGAKPNIDYQIKDIN